jgi:hypothetical protein
MFDSRSPDVSDRQRAEHELWLAMQAAYTNYRNALVAADVDSSQGQLGVSSIDQGSSSEMAVREQRTAFENYIEARIQFVEFKCDQNHPGAGPWVTLKPTEDSRGTGKEKAACWALAAFSLARLTHPAVVVALLCATALSLLYVASEQKQIRDSDLARDEINAELKQARDDVQALVRKIDAGNATREGTIRESIKASDAPVLARTAEGKPAGPGRWRRIRMLNLAPEERSRMTTSKWREDLADHPQNVGGRTYWKFSLPVSRQFQRVGPLSLSLRAVDVKHKHFDLCVTADEFKFEHLNLHEPVWITLRDPSRRVELVAIRIDKNRVQGYLSELKQQKSELAASQVRRRTSGGS